MSGSLFSATKTFRYENEKGEVEIIDANPPIDMTLGATSMIIQQTGDEVSAEDLVKIAKSYGQKTAFYKRLGFDAVTLHMSYRAQLPGQLSPPCPTSAPTSSAAAREPLPLPSDDAGGGQEGRRQRHAGGDPVLRRGARGGLFCGGGTGVFEAGPAYVDIVQVRSAEGDPNHPIPFELKHTPFLELAARIKPPAWTSW